MPPSPNASSFLGAAPSSLPFEAGEAVLSGPSAFNEGINTLPNKLTATEANTGK
jgi:hypothetical protein